jgi:hypothetical protein
MLKELKQIRELLAAKPAPPPPPAKGMWNEFKEFLENYKVMGLAVAFIMGVYLGLLIQSLVKDLLLPAIGLALPGLTDFQLPIYYRKSNVWFRKLSGGTDYFHHRSLCYLPVSEGHQKMGNQIVPQNALS